MHGLLQRLQTSYRRTGFSTWSNVAKIAREDGVVHNLIFKWLRMWQHEGRVSRRLPATIISPSTPSLLPVEIVPEATASDVASGLCPLNASSCGVEFRHCKITLENPSPELLAVLLRELTGRAPG